MSKILEVNDLCKSFVVKKRLLGENDVVSAVNHVSLGLEEGEVLGIVGESGCGKSTVARLLLHSIRPDSGTMKLCGKEYDMAHATGQDVQTFRKNMQMVFQNPYSSLNPKMNVLQNITFGLTANQVPRDEACRRAYRYLDAVGMQKSFLNKYPNSLSGGQWSLKSSWPTSRCPHWTSRCRRRYSTCSTTCRRSSAFRLFLSPMI